MPPDVWYVFRALNRSAFRVLELLYDRGSMGFSDLQKEIGLRGGALMYVVRDLMYGGFVSHPRRGLYAVTGRGKKLVEAVRSGRLWDAILSVFSS